MAWPTINWSAIATIRNLNMRSPHCLMAPGAFEAADQNNTSRCAIEAVPGGLCAQHRVHLQDLDPGTLQSRDAPGACEKTRLRHSVADQERWLPGHRDSQTVA